MRLLIVLCVALIFALGLMMVFNTSSAEILERSLDRNLHQACLRQIVYAVVGIFFALLISRIGYTHLIRCTPLLLAGTCLLLLLVFVPGIGKVRNGSHRWLGIGTLTFQPSEFVKYLLPMAYIDWYLGRKQHNVPFFTFCKVIACLAIPMFLVMIEPDNGTTAVMGASLIPLFFLTGIRFKYWVLPMVVMLTIGVIAAYQLPYIRGRIQVYLHPELDLKGKGHQPYQAKIAAGSGGLLGRGPGASLQKLTYLPEAQNDYIVAIYAEEFGFAGILLLIVLYMLFTFGGFSIAMRSSNPGGTYLAATITFLIGLQAFLNLGVVSGLLPSKGVNLPFFSQGGTSLITNVIGLAVLLNIGSKGTNHNEKKGSFKRGWNRGTSVSGSKFS